MSANRSSARTPPRTVSRSLGPRTASLGAPSQSPETHRRMLQRAHSQQSPTTNYASEYHFSPRRKRVALGDSPASPQRVRRRLFFADGISDACAPEDRERQKQQRRAAEVAALGIIREAVEAGDAHVDLSDLGLESVPDELAELKDLVVLAPSHALVSDLQLTLGANALKHFPQAVSELANLTTLILSHNCLIHLPPEIANLRNLRELSVAHNQLRCLPYELASLPHLHTLSVFPNPFIELPPESPLDVRLRRQLLAAHPARSPWPFRAALFRAGVPRLTDLAARQLSQAQLIALKHRLALCVGGSGPMPLLGRIVGPAVEPSDGGVLAALRVQHLALPLGHCCTACGRWFLMPAAEVCVWAPLSILSRPAPFRLRLCSRNCLYSPALAAILLQPLHGETLGYSADLP
ncbi:hypothetical protein IWW36_002792 [Coemansia brasiliensis]|uniref:Uncharacterized protein n=1 Tax=Coemansia brasiliensis TaxID=2650707 RepID=A0A9W8ICT7_9FUNG|nr:hypothetical protein IWW36_002792 [Coemansia brasiliensis]